jgi:hypothetical protein
VSQRGLQELVVDKIALREAIADVPGGSGDRLSSRPETVVGRFDEASETMRRKTTELIRVGDYAAEVSVELIVDEDDWSPSFSLEDARKLDAVRQALQAGDIAEASKFGRVFELTPVSV